MSTLTTSLKALNVAADFLLELDGAPAAATLYVDLSFAKWEADINKEKPAIAIAETLVAAGIVGFLLPEAAAAGGAAFAAEEGLATATAAVETQIEASSVYKALAATIAKGNAVEAVLRTADGFVIGQTVERATPYVQKIAGNISSLLSDQNPSSEFTETNEMAQAGGSDNGTLNLSGSGTVAFADHWQINEAKNSLAVVVGTDDKGLVGADSGAEFQGSGDTVQAAGADADIMIGGNGKSPTNGDVDKVAVQSSDNVLELDGSSVAVSGSGATLQAGANDTLSLNGDADKLNVDGGGRSSS